jgi:hypothetical protein
MSTDPNEESGSGSVPLIFAIVISMIIVSYAVLNMRHHASAMDEATPPAATKTAPSPAPAPAPAAPTTTP